MPARSGKGTAEEGEAASVGCSRRDRGRSRERRRSGAVATGEGEEETSVGPTFSTLNTCSMEDLPEPLIAEIIKRTTRTSDLNSLSLVSKRLYKVEADERGARDPSYNARYPYKYDISCENMKDLRLAKIVTDQEIGLRFLLGKCKALEKLCLDYVVGLDESEMIALFQNCSNLRSISLRFMPQHCGLQENFRFRTALTDDSLKCLSLYCRML
ncbi:hypothetical protein PR202_gb10054 [Eleusine coracana subsp. coracana]|uniref:F-box domain-containing protein n=1 Tax=Eleusine coracana subsp. coracana TaxID=191504 RepID=A0AAV5EIW9_ELECO|nr:hypothetical protein PR202_gb10054 [Eleusine coracana subsp. coracana]